jgi:hypothetical protein|tara:strand:- start:7438 stop:7680 length:243 start_codon:yes stop_codon:yes gene_type:complete
MGHKRNPKYGKILKCAAEGCERESFYTEGFESWAEHKGEYFCFKCSIEIEEIVWKDQYLTFRTAELDRRKEVNSKQAKTR